MHKNAKPIACAQTVNQRTNIADRKVRKIITVEFKH